MLVLPLAGWLVGPRREPARDARALLAVAFSLPLLALAPTLLTFALAFALFGAVTSALDVAMNAHGVAVEERYARPIFSSFHASWSLGGARRRGRRRRGGGARHLAARAVLRRGGRRGGDLRVERRRAAAARGRRDAGRTRLRRGRRGALVALAALAFAALLAEGAAATGAPSTSTSPSAPASRWPPAGFAAFAATMTLGRVVGDRLTVRWGPVGLTRRAGLLATAGLALALAFGDPVSGIVGFACLGAGLATIVPTVFRAAGLRAATPGAGIAAVSTVGYTAFLVGPPLIGFLSEAIGLRAALVIVVALAALIPLLAGATRAA